MLTAISQKNNKYVLTFHVGGQFDTDVEADMFYSPLPFTTLRDVDIRIPLPDWKTNCIKKLGYGRMQNFLWAFMKEYGGNRVIPAMHFLIMR